MNTLQYVVGEAKAGQPAVIRFFGRVTEETTSRFNDEFDFLENIIRPSCIRVLINSEGGSVLYGMSTYSTNRQCHGGYGMYHRRGRGIDGLHHLGGGQAFSHA